MEGNIRRGILNIRLCRGCLIQSMSRFTGLQFTGLPCLPVFFFRATPSPRFTGGMPVYRGGSFFHARGAPPATAHSHTRCCTQHNTTRWVLRAAANTCLHTMPCAAGELCQLSVLEAILLHYSKPRGYRSRHFSLIHELFFTVGNRSIFLSPIILNTKSYIVLLDTGLKSPECCIEL